MQNVNLCLLVGSPNFKHKSGSFSFPYRLNLLLTSLLNLSSGLCIYSADTLSAALSVFVVVHCLTDCLGTQTAAGFVQYVILLTVTNIPLSPASSSHYIIILMLQKHNNNNTARSY